MNDDELNLPQYLLNNPKVLQKFRKAPLREGACIIKDPEGNEPHGSAHIFCTLEGDTVSYVHKHLAAAVVNGRWIDSHVFKKVMA